jgi:hypothetical protein
MKLQRWALASGTALLLGVVTLGLAGCEDDKPTSTAPSATTLKDTKPKAAGAMDFAIQPTETNVGFTMDASNEKIRGRVPKATKGELQIDLTDLTKTTGHLYVDLHSLSLYQRRKGPDGEFSEEKKNDLQNEHARNWLEIGPCEEADDVEACEAAKKKNENVEFVITEVETAQTDVTKLKGDERKVTAKVTGDFLLHQKKTTQTAEVTITFHMKGDKPETVRVETVEPFSVGLAEHDVRPRTAFGKLAEKTLDVLVSKDKKVAKKAKVSVSFTAKFAGMADTKGAADEKRPDDTKAASGE